MQMAVYEGHVATFRANPYFDFSSPSSSPSALILLAVLHLAPTRLKTPSTNALARLLLTDLVGTGATLRTFPILPSPSWGLSRMSL